MNVSINYTLESDNGDFDTIEITANADLVRDPYGTGDSPSYWDIEDIEIDGYSFNDLHKFDQSKITKLLADEARGY